MDNTFLKSLMNNTAEIMLNNKEYLIKLDSVVGDGDLGLTMSDGFKAAAENMNNSEETDLGKLVYMAGKAMSTAVPSTMGTLMASGLMQAGKALKGQTVVSFETIVAFYGAYEEGVMNRGKAKVGDKTFVDGINPAIKSLRESLESNLALNEAAVKAYDAALSGYENTATMIAVHGRAATRGEASKTLKDPGAYVAVLMMEAFKKTTEIK